MIRRGIATSALVLVASSAACAPPVEHREITRRTAPGGELDAVVVTTDAGSTTAPGFFVHVLGRGGAVTDGHHALRVVGRCCDAAGHYTLEVRWAGPSELVVTYGAASSADPAVPELAAIAGDRPTRVLVHVRSGGPAH